MKLTKVLTLLLVNLVIIHCDDDDLNIYDQTSGPNSYSACGNDNTIDDVAFIRMGTYRGFTEDGIFEYRKSYFYPRYMENSWGESKAICKAFGLELVTLETLAEARNFLALAESSSETKKLRAPFWIFIDGIELTPKSTTDWYWTKNGQKISFLIPWGPVQPDNWQGNERCFSIGKRDAGDRFGYNDHACSNVNLPFICQRIEFWA
ncbi:hypothetical protein ACKWTF_015287 [Chironomus riparius]